MKQFWAIAVLAFIVWVAAVGTVVVVGAHFISKFW